MEATADALWGLISERSVIVPHDCLLNYGTKMTASHQGCDLQHDWGDKDVSELKIKHQQELGQWCFTVATRRKKHTQQNSKVGKRKRSTRNLRYWVHTKAGPFSKAGGLKELLSAEPGITAKERKTTQTNELTIRRVDACWWSFHKNKEYFGTWLNLETNRITNLWFPAPSRLLAWRKQRKFKLWRTVVGVV